MNSSRNSSLGFTLIEVMVTLLILSALALLSYRGLDTVLTARDQVIGETDKWLKLEGFITRFKQDVQMAAPYPLRNTAVAVPAWQGRVAAEPGRPMLEFSRFAAVVGQDKIRRIAYSLDASGELELWLWPGLDRSVTPAHYPVLSGVQHVEFAYMNASLVWVSLWPSQPEDAAIPRAVRLRLELSTGEVLIRLFALGT